MDYNNLYMNLNIKLTPLIIIFSTISVYSQNECPPCELIINSNEDYKKKIDYKWPKIKSKSTIKINSLTKVLYENDDEYWKSSSANSWWKKDNSDPWIEGTTWSENYVDPDHNFKKCVNDNLRWKCGYSYVIKTPNNFKKSKKYPLVISLHGGISGNPRQLDRRANYGDNFFVPVDDEYIIVSPIKLGVDWSSRKISDLILDVSSNLKIDENRIYLTGLSMGGRGTFIVASELIDTFAAIMPFSPHHTPYSYKEKSNVVSHLPIYLHHSKNDKVSSFSIAEDTYNDIKSTNDNIIFNIGNSGHSGWPKLYGDESIIRWLLSWEKE